MTQTGEIDLSGKSIQSLLSLRDGYLRQIAAQGGANSHVWLMVDAVEFELAIRPGGKNDEKEDEENG